MKKFLKYSILNVVGKDIVIHIVLPIMIIVIGILLYKTNCYNNIYAIGMFITMKLSLIFINWYNYTSYPKRHRPEFHYEFIPVFGFGIITEKYIGIVIPYFMFSINFTHLYNHKRKLL
jgi:hypothetical protein